MHSDRLLDVPVFTIEGVTFRCWETGDGPNEIGIEGRVCEWRSTCGRYRVGRSDGMVLCYAIAYGKDVRGVFTELRSAMEAAARILPPVGASNEGSGG